MTGAETKPISQEDCLPVFCLVISDHVTIFLFSRMAPSLVKFASERLSVRVGVLSSTFLICYDSLKRKIHAPIFVSSTCWVCF